MIERCRPILDVDANPVGLVDRAVLGSDLDVGRGDVLAEGRALEVDDRVVLQLAGRLARKVDVVDVTDSKLGRVGLAVGGRLEQTKTGKCKRLKTATGAATVL